MQTNPSCNTIAFLLKILCWILYIWSSVVMLNILQARLQQYVNRELLDVQAGFRKGRGTRDQIANVRICIYIFFSFSLWFLTGHWIQSPCYAGGPCLRILCMMLCMGCFQTPSSSLLHPPPWQPRLFSMSVSLYVIGTFICVVV